MESASSNSRDITDFQVARFSLEEIADVRKALAEAEAEFARGKGMNSEEIRRKLGLHQEE